MSRNDEIFDLSKRVRRLEHERRHRAAHPEGNFQKDDFAWNGCVWLFVFLFLIGILLTFILVPYYRYPPPPPPAKDLPPPQFVKHAPKRTRGACAQAGEYFDAQLQMCAPQIHLPMAFDATIMNTNVQACHSFYNNSCGKWIEQHPTMGEHRTFTFAHHKNQALLKQIITNRSNTPLNDFYQSCLSKNAHEAGIELKHVINVVTENLRSHADLPSTLGKLARFGYTGPFVLSIERHPTEPRMLPLITYDNLRVDEQVIYIMLNQARGLLNYNVLDLQRRVQAIVKVIRTLSEHCPEYDRVDAITNYAVYVNTTFPRHLFKFGTMQKWNLKGVHGTVDGWYQFFHALDGHGLKFNTDQDVWNIGNGYMTWLLREGFNAFELFEWRAYLEFSILFHAHQFEPELPNNVYRSPSPLRGEGARGKSEIRLQRKAAQRNAAGPLGPADCIALTQHMLPGLVARAFLDLRNQTEYEAMRKRIFDLTMHLRETLVQTINMTDWLPALDRVALVNKLNKIIVRVAEPDEWQVEPFAGQIALDRYDHNMNMIRKFRVERNLQLWSIQDVSLHRSAYATFAMPLDAVNAYYSASTNTITILAGILQLPFFDKQFNRVSEYAILGSVIGHELSHALDANGLYWNDEGSFVSQGIISYPSMREFKIRSGCLIQEYQQEQRTCANYGEQTLSENIADVTGIHLAYKALAPSSMSDRQYFFFVLSQAFCEAASIGCSDDVHAAAKFRIDLTFRNMPEFSETFNCVQGQRMFKRDKCEIYSATAAA